MKKLILAALIALLLASPVMADSGGGGGGGGSGSGDVTAGSVTGGKACEWNATGPVLDCTRTFGVAATNVFVLPADPAAHTILGFDNTTNTYKNFTIGSGLGFTQATSTLASSPAPFVIDTQGYSTFTQTWSNLGPFTPATILADQAVTTLTISETGAVNGAIVCIINESGYAVTVANQANALELESSPFTLPATKGRLWIEYKTDRWVELARLPLNVGTSSVSSGVPACGSSTAGSLVDCPDAVIEASSTLSITAAQMRDPACQTSNVGQAGTAADAYVQLPTAAAKLACLFTTGEVAAYKFGVRAAASDKIYLIAADGTVTSGNDNKYAKLSAASIGQSFACWTFISGTGPTYDWSCKSIAIGAATFTIGDTL